LLHQHHHHCHRWHPSCWLLDKIGRCACTTEHKFWPYHPQVMPRGRCNKIGRQEVIYIIESASSWARSARRYTADEREIGICAPPKNHDFLPPSERLSASGSGGRL
jgi:hypothetical protein